MGPIQTAVLLPLLAAIALSNAQLSAQQTRPLAPPPDPSSPDKMPDAAVKELEDGRLQIGKVIIDKKARTLTFPTEVNMNTGLVEYFLVTTRGKTHESVLRTETEPYHIHVAMLLLGAKAAMSADPAIFFNGKNELPGDRISIEVSWKQGDVKKRMPAEDLVNNLEKKKVMDRGPWAYNGSQIIDGSFVAQRDGSIIAIIGDPYALINNPRLGRENDEIWAAGEGAVPPLDTPVELVIQFKS